MHARPAIHNGLVDVPRAINVVVEYEDTVYKYICVDLMAYCPTKCYNDPPAVSGYVCNVYLYRALAARNLIWTKFSMPTTTWDRSGRVNHRPRNLANASPLALRPTGWKIIARASAHVHDNWKAY